jgi:predicted  nucleic acid-binding Zn ribbon protein
MHQAEERIRHEIADADENVYKKGFDVDVNVEVRGGRPIAYRVVAVHSVIDLSD